MLWRCNWRLPKVVSSCRAVSMPNAGRFQWALWDSTVEPSRPSSSHFRSLPDSTRCSSPKACLIACGARGIALAILREMAARVIPRPLQQALHSNKVAGKAGRDFRILPLSSSTIHFSYWLAPADVSSTLVVFHQRARGLLECLQSLKADLAIYCSVHAEPEAFTQP